MLGDKIGSIEAASLSIRGFEQLMAATEILPGH